MSDICEKCGCDDAEINKLTVVREGEIIQLQLTESLTNLDDMAFDVSKDFNLCKVQKILEVPYKTYKWLKCNLDKEFDGLGAGGNEYTGDNQQVRNLTTKDICNNKKYLEEFKRSNVELVTCVYCPEKSKLFFVSPQGFRFCKYVSREYMNNSIEVENIYIINN